MTKFYLRSGVKEHIITGAQTHHVQRLNLGVETQVSNDSIWEFKLPVHLLVENLRFIIFQIKIYGNLHIFGRFYIFTIIIYIYLKKFQKI